ncbi:MAG: peroxiredoxin [Pseudomonadota bacterium]
MGDKTIIQPGTQAPDFTLKDQDEKEVRLSGLKGKKVLLSFHPLAWTAVCAKQMKALEDNYEVFRERGAVALGLSIDHAPTKRAWAKELGIAGTRLLADFWPHGEAAKAYDNFIDKLGFSGRANVLIDETGKVVWSKVYELSELPDIEEVLGQL